MTHIAAPQAALTIRPPYPLGTVGIAMAPPERAVAPPPDPTREEAHEARRRAAEMGDYVLADRWYRYERRLAARDLGATRG